MKKEGSGGFSKDIHWYFFMELFVSYTVERIDKIPYVRQNMTKIEWNAVTRILIAAMKVDCYSLSFLPAFLISTLFDEKELNDDILMNSFKNYVSLEKKKTFQAMLSEFEEANEELLKMLSFCNCYRKPTRENFRAIVVALAQQ